MHDISYEKSITNTKLATRKIIYKNISSLCLIIALSLYIFYFIKDSFIYCQITAKNNFDYINYFDYLLFQFSNLKVFWSFFINALIIISLVCYLVFSDLEKYKKIICYFFIGISLLLNVIFKYTDLGLIIRTSALLYCFIIYLPYLMVFWSILFTSKENVLYKIAFACLPFLLIVLVLCGMAQNYGTYYFKSQLMIRLYDLFLKHLFTFYVIEIFYIFTLFIIFVVLVITNIINCFVKNPKLYKLFAIPNALIGFCTTVINSIILLVCFIKIIINLIFY